LNLVEPNSVINYT